MLVTTKSDGPLSRFAAVCLAVLVFGPVILSVGVKLFS